MYGPLALCNGDGALCNGDGSRAPRFGLVQAVMNRRDSAKSPASARRGEVIMDVGGLDGGMRLLRMSS